MQCAILVCQQNLNPEIIEPKGSIFFNHGLSLNFFKADRVSKNEFIKPVTECTLKEPVNFLKKYCLKVVGRYKYKEAKSVCQSENARLILPRSKSETVMLMELLMRKAFDFTPIFTSEYPFWSIERKKENYLIIDISDAENEGIWIDSRGQQISYSNWRNNTLYYRLLQPDNLNGNEHFAGIAVDLFLPVVLPLKYTDYTTYIERIGSQTWVDESGEKYGWVICQQKITSKIFFNQRV